MNSAVSIQLANGMIVPRYIFEPCNTCRSFGYMFNTDYPKHGKPHLECWNCQGRGYTKTDQREIKFNNSRDIEIFIQICKEDKIDILHVNWVTNTVLIA